MDGPEHGAIRAASELLDGSSSSFVPSGGETARLDKIHFGDTSNDLYLSFHSYLVRTASHTILVDSCCGNDKTHAHEKQGDQSECDAFASVTARSLFIEYTLA